MDSLIRIQPIVNLSFTDVELELLLIAGRSNYGVAFNSELFEPTTNTDESQEYNLTDDTYDTVDMLHSTVDECLTHGVYSHREEEYLKYGDNLVEPAEKLHDELKALKDYLATQVVNHH